jgi:hypothetical protein
MNQYCRDGVVTLGLLLWGDGATDVQEPGVEEPSAEKLYVEEPFHSQRGLAGSSEELKRE